MVSCLLFSPSFLPCPLPPPPPHPPNKILTRTFVGTDERRFLLLPPFRPSFPPLVRSTHVVLVYAPSPSWLSLSTPRWPGDWLTDWLQPKLGKVSNVVKASLEETLRSAKEALSNAEIEAEMEKDTIDITLPG